MYIKYDCKMHLHNYLSPGKFFEKRKIKNAPLKTIKKKYM